MPYLFAHILTISIACVVIGCSVPLLVELTREAMRELD